MAETDKNWAQQYINNPLTAPDPSDETGPGASLRSDVRAQPSTPSRDSHRSKNTNPFRSESAGPKSPSSHTERLYPSPPPSASPRHSPRSSLGHRSEFISNGTRPRRSSSLRERYPGDPSVRPLDQLAQEKAIADKARHITKKHAVRPDTIDSLDSSGIGQYHHEGPYDATLFARNNSWKSSPVAAVIDSNNEAIKATPRDKIVDSVRGHRPLDGVAAYPPGTVDREGQSYNYQEGDNMMIEENAAGGPYKRWPGVQYHPDDIKGKGEPSYTIEKALKEKRVDDKGGDIEMTSNHSRSASGSHRQALVESDGGLGRKNSLSDRLRKRVGSIKKKLKEDE